MYTFPDTCQIKDLSLIYEKYFGKEKGTFVEVGAYDGYMFSNTWGLAVAGWTGLYIEPVLEFYNRCINNHIGHAVKVLNCAAGSYKGGLQIHYAGTLTSASTDQIEFLKGIDWAKDFITDITYTVPSDTLDNLLKENNIPLKFETLVIDVEGHETEVLKGFSVDYWKPKMIIIEAQEHHQDTELRHQAKFINSYFEEARYTKIYSDEINNIYLS